ncbi:MAG: LuxR C-terminal-related transcriptional regulator [Acidimicrobiales bacterium]
MAAELDGLLIEARAALQSGDAGAARRFVGSGAVEPATGDVLEVLARADYLDLAYPAAIEGWERAYAAFRRDDDHVGAVRVARTLSCMYLTIIGDRAIGAGWLARAQTLLGDRPDSPERGWVELDLGMFETERERKHEHFRRALDHARTQGDPALELSTLAYLGASLVHADRVDEGMALLDEALAAVAGSEVDDFCVLEEIFCQLFAACEHARDVDRADQWIRVGEAIAQRRRLPAVSAFCHTHYGGVLIAAGRWGEAETALTDAVRLWGLGQRSVLRGGALVRLADLRVRQGRFEEAGQLLAGLDPVADDEASHVRAAIHAARGELPVARDLVERALDRLDPLSSAAAPLLALLVDVHLAAGAVDRAADAAGRLAGCAGRHDNEHLRATAALAEGKVGLAAGTGDPPSCLRQALAGFRRARMPLEVAHTRLELARALAESSPEVAAAEARAALEAFERLDASRLADAAAALLRTLGVRARVMSPAPGLLTRREQEVLDLVGHGLSNPEIAERLYISRKTVEHHVGNVLAKLGLRSRSEAAAYAVRSASPGTP